MLPHLRFLFSFAGKSYSLKIFSQSQKGAQLCIFFVYRFHSGSKFFHEQLLIQLHAPIFEAFFRFWMRYIYFYICNCYKNYIYTIYIHNLSPFFQKSLNLSCLLINTSIFIHNIQYTLFILNLKACIYIL